MAARFHRNQTPGSWCKTPHLQGAAWDADHLLPVERALLQKVEERGPGYSLQRAFQRYEALGRDGSVSADEFRALLRNFNLEVEHDDLAYIVAACRPLPPTTTSSYARTPGTTPGRDASGLPRLDCRRFMERLKGLDNSALASSTPLSGVPTPRRTQMYDDHHRFSHHKSAAADWQVASPSGARPPHATTTSAPVASVSKAGYAMSAGMDDDAFVEKFVSLVQTKLDERCDGPHKLHDAFKYFDRMGVGRLDVAAFRAACERLMIHLTDREAQVLMDRFGTGPHGTIDHARFADALLADRFEGAPAANWVPRFTGGETYEHRLSVREFRTLLEEKLVNNAGGRHGVRRAFKIFDPAGTGLITYSQFTDALHRLNISPTPDSMKAILREFDADHDGVIDYADFVNAITQDNQYYQWDEERLAPDQLRPGLQAHRVAAAHQHTTAENMELTVPRLEALVRQSLESSGVVLCKGGALALRRIFQFYDREGRGALPAPQFRLALEKRFQLTLSDDLFRQLLAKYDADADGLIDYTYLSRMMLPECFPDDAQTVGDAAQLPPEGTAEYFQRMQLLAPYGDATNTPHGPAGTCTPATPAFAAAAAAERGGSEECTPGWARGQEYPRPSAPTVSSQFVALGDIDRLLRDKLMGLSATCGSELRRAFQRFNPNGKGPMSYSQFRQGLRLFYIELSNDDFAQLVARYDPTGCGQIDYTAFVTSLVPPSYSADWNANGAAAPLSASAAARSARAAVTHDLTLAEFESMLADRLQHATGCFGNTGPSSVHKAARRLDITGTGVLSVAQFQAALHGLNFTVPSQLLERLLERYGDGCGRVDCARVASCVLREHANAYDTCHVLSQVFTPRLKPRR